MQNMKYILKAFIMFLIALVSIWGQAQSQKFYYELEFKLDSLQKEPYKENYILESDKDYTKFYNLNFYELDSTNKKFNETSQISLPMGVYSLLKRKKNSDVNINYVFVGSHYYSFMTEDKITWKLTNEVKLHDGYHLQKAITKFGKRQWVAWFSKDVNINVGPYKFDGLPGLIFFLHDSNNNYSFKLLKSTRSDNSIDTRDFLESNFGKKPIQVTAEKYLSLCINHYNNLYNDQMNIPDGQWKIETQDGRLISSKSQLRGLIESEQKILKNRNNPIDKNLIIPYKNANR